MAFLRSQVVVEVSPVKQANATAETIAVIVQKGYLFLAVVAALVVVKAVAVVFGRSPVDTFRLKPTGRAVSTAAIFSIMARQAALAAAMSSKDAIVASAKWRMAITQPHKYS